MKLIKAFFQMVRWPNLLFIALTQGLFYYCIFLPLYGVEPHVFRITSLVLASVLIAAAGYIINDYFDLNIDQVNKPQQNVIDRIVHRRWAILWHLFLSFLGIVATVMAVGLSKWYLVGANIICVALLWFYSTSFKRQLLIGNVVISLLTAWTILIVFFAFTNPANAIGSDDSRSIRFFRLAFLYGGFSFVLSMVREAIKDMQDLEGDARYGCKTLPIVAGLKTTMIYVFVWLVVLIAALIIMQLYILQFRTPWWGAFVYSTVLIILPLAFILLKLFRARTSAQFGHLSSLAKLVMLTGIFSMIFFRFYFT
jgi:4-hydroxybenzoate polyprenyltransferase